MANASLSLPRAGLAATALRALGDDRLAALAARGDERAFTVVFERYHQGLYRYCRSILGNSEDAADALQSTMLSALRALPGERRSIALKPWLYRIAHNESISILRARRNEHPLEETVREGSAGPEERAIERERIDDVFADLRNLPDRQRAAIVMREVSGLSYAEIAAAFGTSAATATQAVFDARKTLHELAAGRDMTCDDVQLEISRRDGRVLLSRRLRSHLRSCAECARFRELIDERAESFAVLAPPLAPVAAAALLQALRSSAGAAGGGGGLAAVGPVAAGKALVSSAALKATAGVVAAASVGAGTAAVVAPREPATRLHPSSPRPPRPRARLAAAGLPLAGGRAHRRRGLQAQEQRTAARPARRGRAQARGDRWSRARPDRQQGPGELVQAGVRRAQGQGRASREGAQEDAHAEGSRPQAHGRQAGSAGAAGEDPRQGPRRLRSGRHRAPYGIRRNGR